jgi:hypothetical protein
MVDIDFEEMFEMVLYESLSDELKEFVKTTSFFGVDQYGFVVDDKNHSVSLSQIEDQKTYYETGEL